MDENSETRKAVAIFVCKLPWIPNSLEHLHPNYALLLVYKHAIPEVCGSPVCGRQLAGWIREKDGLDVSDVLLQENSDQWVYLIWVEGVVF